MSIADALSRITQIQAQFAELRSGNLPAAATGTATAGGTAAGGAAGTTAGAATATAAGTSAGSSFAGALAQAQLAQSAQSAATAGQAGSSPAGTAGSLLGTGTAGALLGTGTAGTSLGTTPATFGNALLSGQLSGVPGLGQPAPLAPASGGVALPAAGAAQLTSAQQQFAQTLAADTGLDPGVISAWLLAEESGGAAQTRQAQGNNDWLNIGYTDTGTFGSTDAIWSNPVTAANATAGWLRGQATIPGYGTASPGIQAILQTAGQPPQTQIAALQGSGWASSGYPDLPALYTQVAG